MKRNIFRFLSMVSISFVFLLLGVLVYNASSVRASEGLDITIGSEFIIDDGGTTQRAYPSISKVDGDLYVGFSATNDNSVGGYRKSTDGGATWPTYVANAQFPPKSIAKLADGTLFGVFFSTYRINATQSTVIYWKSTDNGTTWTKYSGTLTLPEAQKDLSNGLGAVYFHNPLLIRPDGSIESPVYARYAADTKYASLLLRSTDGGVTWSVKSTIARSESSPGDGYSEPTVAIVKDGTYLSVFRTSTDSLVPAPLYQSRSYDDGLTWSIPVLLPGVSDSTYGGGSVAPDMLLMSNGVLALAYGRPYAKILFSSDGSGYEWNELRVVYDGVTSANGGIREVSPNRLLYVGDKGAIWQSPGVYKIWGKYIDVERTTVPGAKIDLFSKYKAGTVTVSTDMIWTNPAAPGLGIANALDGIPNSFYRAIRSGPVNTAYYTVTLDKIYNISTLGICLKPGFSESANIYFSMDGVNWGTPVKSFTNVTHGDETDYTTFSTAISAKYVKVSVNDATSNPSLTELQLFYNPDPSVPQSFEDGVVGSVPPGFIQIASSTLVSNTKAFEGTKSLRIYDNSASVQSHIRKVANASTSKILDFKVYPVNVTAGNLFVIGKTGVTGVYQMAIFPDLSLRWYNGSVWTVLSGPNTVSLNTWSSIRVEALNTTAASIYVNGVLKGTVGISGSSATMDFVSFFSGGTATVGDDFYVDNVYFADTADSFEGETGSVPYGFIQIAPSTLVSNTKAFEGTKSLRIYDNSASVQSHIRKVANASTSKILDFKVYPVNVTAGNLFVIGKTGVTSVYQMAIFPDLSLRWYNGIAWTVLSGPNTVSLNTWSSIRVEALNTTAASIYVNGVLKGTVGISGSSATMDFVSFFSGGTATVGDDFYVDNVYFADY